MATETSYQKLRREVETLRKAHPDTAALMDADEMLAKAVEMLREQQTTVQGAILKSLRNPVRAGATVSSEEGPMQPPAGARDITQQFLAGVAKTADSDPRVQKRRDKIAAEAERLEKTRRHLRERRIDR